MIVEHVELRQPCQRVLLSLVGSHLATQVAVADRFGPGTTGFAADPATAGHADPLIRTTSLGRGHRLGCSEPDGVPRMTVVPDKTFGNRGTLWSGVAVLFQSGFTDDQYVHTVGGFTTGVHVLPNGSACLVVGGWSYFPPPATLGVEDKARRYTTVKMVVFPPDGSPQDRLRWDAHPRRVRVEAERVGPGQLLDFDRRHRRALAARLRSSPCRPIPLNTRCASCLLRPGVVARRGFARGGSTTP